MKRDNTADTRRNTEVTLIRICPRWKGNNYRFIRFNRYNRNNPPQNMKSLMKLRTSVFWNAGPCSLSSYPPLCIFKSYIFMKLLVKVLYMLIFACRLIAWRGRGAGTRTNIHAMSGTQTRDSSMNVGYDHACLKLCRRRDRLM